MIKEIKELNVSSIKEEILKYLESQKGEQITEAKEDELIGKRNEFIDWLSNQNLMYLLDFDSEKTSFEWKVTIDILNILMKFDELIEQHDKVFGKPIDRINEVLRQRMAYFSKDYDEPKIIDECSQEVLPKVL